MPEAFNSSLDVGWGKTQSIQYTAEKDLICIIKLSFKIETLI